MVIFCCHWWANDLSWGLQKYLELVVMWLEMWCHHYYHHHYHHLKVLSIDCIIYCFALSIICNFQWINFQSATKFSWASHDVTWDVMSQLLSSPSSSYENVTSWLYNLLLRTIYSLQFSVNWFIEGFKSLFN